jgi:hypothetical protein
MRPVLGRDRLPEEIAGRRIERVVETHEARVAREDRAIGELDLLRKPLEGGDGRPLPAPAPRPARRGREAPRGVPPSRARRGRHAPDWRVDWRAGGAGRFTKRNGLSLQNRCGRAAHGSVGSTPAPLRKKERSPLPGHSREARCRNRPRPPNVLPDSGGRYRSIRARSSCASSTSRRSSSSAAPPPWPLRPESSSPERLGRTSGGSGTC